MPKKIPVIIDCAGCDKSFRLWIPAELLSGFGEGEEVLCVRCGKKYLIKKGETRDKPIVSVVSGKAPAEARIKEAMPLKTVLYMDSDKLSSAISEDALKKIGLNFIPANNGEDALELFREKDIDLIVTDLYIRRSKSTPDEMGAEEILRDILESGDHTPSVLMTGRELIDDIAMDPKWFELKVKAFVQKGNPFWTDELKDKVREVLGIH